jgi:hypothetical protein
MEHTHGMRAGTRRRHRCAMALVLSVCAAGMRPTAHAATPAPRSPISVVLRIRVARCPPIDATGTVTRRMAVRPDAWVDEHVAAAREILAPHGITLTVERDSFTPARCELLDRSQRNAMARHAPLGAAVVVLVTRRIRDLDLPTYDLMGVHWRYRGAERRWRGRRWVFLTARARPPVLAHELAHFFGVRHDPAGGNLMTPGPSDPIWRRPGNKPKPFVPRLSSAQAKRLRRGIRRFVRHARSIGGKHPTPAR